MITYWRGTKRVQSAARYVGQMSVGAVAHADVMRSIELFGTKVAPIVRAEIDRRSDSAAQAA